MEGEPSALLCGRHEEVEHTEPVGARLAVDDVSGDVVRDGRIWQCMPLLAVTDPAWMPLDAIFPPRLPDTPTPLDPLRWTLTYERDGVEAVVEPYTDTADEVAVAIDDPTDVVTDTARVWAVRVSSDDPHAATDLPAELVSLPAETWYSPIGVEWGVR
jgi:hypothetical protein